MRYALVVVGLVLLLLVACRQDGDGGEGSDGPPPTAAAAPTAVLASTPDSEADINFIVVATDAPNPPFADFNLIGLDEFGLVTGFDARVMQNLANHLGWDQEFVVTSFEGMLDSVANGEFDAAISALTTEGDDEPGIAFTDPYLEVGQVLVVRADDRQLQSYNDIQPGQSFGAVAFSHGEATAREIIGLAEDSLTLFDDSSQALQALVYGLIDGVIIDHDDAEYYTRQYWQQLKIAGGNERDAWISQRAYSIAVADENQGLRDSLNAAIAATEEEQLAAVDEWLITKSPIDAGESLIGTPADQLVVGAVSRGLILDPAAIPDLLGWELMANTMSGLLHLQQDGELAPLLAEDLPIISDDGLEYIFTLREGLAYPDGRPLTASDVKWSIDRGASRGIAVINGVLKDADDNGFADDDAVVVLNPQQIQLNLQEPASYFMDLLTTPPYFPVSQECYTSSPNPQVDCQGLGQYTIVDWFENEKIDLRANDGWPGEAPLFEQIQIRLYPDSVTMRASLDNSAIDIAWTGLTEADLSELGASSGLRSWAGASSFKSYLVFEQSQPPWNDPRIRQAAAFALDRAALAAVFDNQRQELYSPVPDSTPGHVPTKPQRDLDQARELLAQAGYSEAAPLPISIWYISDGRYSAREEAYAAALKKQLEETAVFQVTLESAPWDIYRAAMSSCQYPAFLLGWPTPGQPPRSPDPSSWLYYFVTNTENLCSNYQSSTMDELVASTLAINPLRRDELAAGYAAIQELWALEYPTLDLTQAPRIAVSLTNVNDVTAAIDPLGLLHYGRLSKGSE